MTLSTTSTIIRNSAMLNNNSKNASGEQQQIIRGMLHVAILAELGKGKKCGVDLLLALEKTPFSSKVGTLYPLLTRMEKNKLLSSDWSVATSHTPRKYYRLTKLGGEKLKEYRNFLRQVHQYLGGESS